MNKLNLIIFALKIGLALVSFVRFIASKIRLRAKFSIEVNAYRGDSKTIIQLETRMTFHIAKIENRDAARTLHNRSRANSRTVSIADKA